MAENDAEGAGTKAKRILREVTYPHNIHPAMVPGVSVEDQKIRYRVDKPMLTVVGRLGRSVHPVGRAGAGAGF